MHSAERIGTINERNHHSFAFESSRKTPRMSFVGKGFRRRLSFFVSFYTAKISPRFGAVFAIARPRSIPLFRFFAYTSPPRFHPQIPHHHFRTFRHLSHYRYTCLLLLAIRSALALPMANTLRARHLLHWAKTLLSEISVSIARLSRFLMPSTR